MNSLQVTEAAEQLAESGTESNESIRTDEFSLEVMRFEPGDEDPLHAHAEEEIYHINAGSAELNIDGDIRSVSPGDVIHLEPGTDHQFRNFEEELVMTVMYAPAKGSNN